MHVPCIALRCIACFLLAHRRKANPLIFFCDLFFVFHVMLPRVGRVYLLSSEDGGGGGLSVGVV